MFYALITLNMMKNKKVCVPSLCWATDLAPVLQFNLEPILIDCNLENLSVDLNHLDLMMTLNRKFFVLVQLIYLNCTD
jgi:dTDP-4-amino-4,6-dideoxygalactose transaminase